MNKGHQQSVNRLRSRPGWVLPNMIVDLDFVANRFFVTGTQQQFVDQLTVVSSAGNLAADQAGIYRSFAANTPRWTNRGLLVEVTRTNVIIRNRDLTQAAWVKTNMTAAFDQIGVDNAANAASRITATANNATALQTVTLGSSARLASALVKRLVGTGTVEMTTDNGTTWTAIVPTAAWARFQIPTQTLANPVTGFRLGTSGDSIAVDLVQNENSSTITSPIATTTVAVARANDAISMPVPVWFNSRGLTLYAEAEFAALNSGAVVSFDDGTTTNRIYIRDNGNGQILGSIVDGGVTQASLGAGSYAANTIVKVAMAIEFNNALLACNGAQSGGDSACTIPTAITTLRFGAAGTATSSLASCYIRRVGFSPVRLPQNRLKDLSS